eukprot:2488441-Pleurochrysis_carterae.AAC.1
MQNKPNQLLGMNIDLGKDGSVKVSAAAYVKAKAECYLPKPLAEYPRFETPSTPQLEKDYAIAARKEHYVDPIFQKKYQSKVGALIYAPPLVAGRARHTPLAYLLAHLPSPQLKRTSMPVVCWRTWRKTPTRASSSSRADKLS